MMGRTEVAMELGIKPSNLDKVANLPKPVQTLERGDLWLESVIGPFAVGFKERRAERAEKSDEQEAAGKR
jgi:hypothetical protein